MARQARVKEAFGTYYVNQQSSGCRPLFQNDDDRQYFIHLLQKTVNTFNCRVIDYCAQNNDTYHLIIDVNGGDLSKIMKSINIAYGMYATCEGKLFKDRYKSQPIVDDHGLAKIRDSIKTSISENGGYSSFCVSEITPFPDAKETTCTDCIATMDEAYTRLNTVAVLNQRSIHSLLKDKPMRNDLIKEIRRSSTLSLKTIGEVFGGLSESTVCKILSQ